MALRNGSLGLCLASLFVISACAHRVVPPSFAGSIVPPYPAEMKEREGACVGTGDTLHVCEYSVAILDDAAGKPAWIYAGHSQGNDDLGKPRWLVTDVLPYPRTSQRRVLLIATCLYKKEADASVLAVVDDPQAEAKPATNWAYRVDPATGKFLQLDRRDVACYEPQGDD